MGGDELSKNIILDRLAKKVVWIRRPRSIEVYDTTKRDQVA